MLSYVTFLKTVIVAGFYSEVFKLCAVGVDQGNLVIENQH